MYFFDQASHLPCAAAEVPLAADDARLFGVNPIFFTLIFSLPSDTFFFSLFAGGAEAFAASLRGCVRSRALVYNKALSSYVPHPDTSGDHPAGSVALRGGAQRATFELHDESKLCDDDRESSVVERMDLQHAVTKCFPGAIFRHQRATFEVRSLDLENGVALCKPMVDAPFQTTPREKVDITRVGAPTGRAEAVRVSPSRTRFHPFPPHPLFYLV